MGARPQERETLRQRALPAVLMDRLDVGVIVQGPDSEILYSNSRATELLGVEPSGRTSFDPRWDVVRPDGTSFPPEHRPVARALTTAEPQKDVVLGVRLPTGERSWLLANAIPYIDEDGAVDYVVVTLSDISSERRRMAVLQQVKDELEQAVSERTAELARSVDELRSEISQRVQAEQALSRSESLYRSVLRAMAEGVALHNADGSIEYANPAAERILGLTLQQLRGLEAVDPKWGLLEPDGGPLPPDQIPSEVTRLTGQPCTQRQLGVQRSNGERAWLSVNTDPVDDRGVPELRGGVVATFSDVTQARENQIALERSRQQFERVTGAVPGLLYQAHWTDDGEVSVTFVSAAAPEVLGLSSEALKADPSLLGGCIHPDDMAAALASAAAAHQEGHSWECDVRVTPPGAALRWIRNRAVPQRTRDGVLWTGVALDVTEERRLADQVHVAQRREAIGAVTAGIAHNFNNALAVLLPNLEESIARAPTDLLQPLNESLEAARSARDLVRQLMFIARGGDQDEAQRFDLGQIVTESAQMFRRLLRGRVEVRELVPESPLWITCPAGALHQVLLNLCINSQDALDDMDGGVVELALTRVGVNGEPRARLFVRDNGPGMTEDVRARLGEPFFTTKPPGAGTGLGLATAYTTIRSLAGTVDCRSAPGKGCEFTIEIPLAEAEPVVPPCPEVPTLSRDVGRILVADDEALVRAAIARVLSRHGHSVDEVGTGEEALERVRSASGAYDVAVVDLSMPGLSGEKVLATLTEEFPDLPVIILSGFIDDSVEIGDARVTLLKPVSTAKLLESIQAVLPHNREQTRQS